MLERLMDGYIKNSLLIDRPLFSSQYAYREGRSTEMTLHHLVAKVEEEIEKKGYAMEIFLGIEGAFDRTRYDVIMKAMSKRGFPETVIDWTQSMLASISLTAADNEAKVEGCPQGHPPSLKSVNAVKASKLRRR
ncbi:uncharacterized protein LOC107045548 [Diachasma alloeum]|uniref:uncharacterized protein LOC107045548 n=1 Tax=Diachasma alloeum TaxID=454923 RepID=UPI00073838E6|nr:uncharacterized protein LOC107045548 [Diachasma alloeum]